jgi:hypothetical protein
MALNHPALTVDTFADYLLQKLNPQEILDFQAPEESQAYARELIERNNAGTLSPEEENDVQQILQFERMMNVLKSKALLALYGKS